MLQACHNVASMYVAMGIPSGLINARESIVLCVTCALQNGHVHSPRADQCERGVVL